MLKIENITIERHSFGLEVVAAISFNGCSDKITCEWWDGEATEWQLLVTLPSCARVSPYNGTASVRSAASLASLLARCFELDRSAELLADNIWEAALKIRPKCTPSESYYGH